MVQTVSIGWIVALAWLLSLLLWVLPAAAQTCVGHERPRLLASDGVDGDEFGGSVSLSGDLLAIGAPYNDNVSGPGAAYVFRRTSAAWAEEAKVAASDGPNADSFGHAVHISSVLLAVGDPRASGGATTFSGVADIFRYDGASWPHESRLAASDAADFDFFGYSVATAGAIAMIGSPRDDNANGANAGAVYVFRFDGANWIEDQKLLASDGTSGDEFGFSVSIADNLLLIGAPSNPSNPGWAYVFRYNGSSWAQEAKLIPAGGANYDNFGSSVSVEAATGLVGAVYDDDLGSSSGSAFVFQFNGSSWNQQAELHASDGQAYEYFGFSVSLSGDRAMVGAVEDGYNNKAYVYKFNGASWDEQAKLTASDGSPYDYLGSPVSLSGETGVFGSREGFDGSEYPGAAYIFPAMGDCNHNGDLDICDFTVGASLDADSDAIPDECEDGPAPVPTVGQWGLFILSIMILTSATILFGRPRRNTDAISGH